MMPQRTPLKPPNKDYSGLSNLGLRGWFKELTRLREQAIKHRPELLIDDPKIKTHDIGGNRRVFLPGAPVVQFVGPQDRDVRIPRYLLPVLIVNISAPESVIMAEFKRQLRQAQHKFPPPLRKPGPHAANYRFDESIFRRWCHAHIVEFADLLAWNVSGGKRHSERELGEFLGHRDKAQTYRVKKMLKDAIAALPIVAAQIKYDANPARRAEYLKEAEAMEDPDVLGDAKKWAEDSSR